MGRVNPEDLIALGDVVVTRPMSVANLQSHDTIQVTAQGRIGGSRNYRGSYGISPFAVCFESCFALSRASEKQLAAALEDRTQRGITSAAVIPDPVFPFPRSIGRLGSGKDRRLRERRAREQDK